MVSLKEVCLDGGGVYHEEEGLAECAVKSPYMDVDDFVSMATEFFAAYSRGGPRSAALRIRAGEDEYEVELSGDLILVSAYVKLVGPASEPCETKWAETHPTGDPAITATAARTPNPTGIAKGTAAVKPGDAEGFKAELWKVISAAGDALERARERGC